MSPRPQVQQRAPPSQRPPRVQEQEFILARWWASRQFMALRPRRLARPQWAQRMPHRPNGPTQPRLLPWAQQPTAAAVQPRQQRAGCPRRRRRTEDKAGRWWMWATMLVLWLCGSLEAGTCLGMNAQYQHPWHSFDPTRGFPGEGPVSTLVGPPDDQLPLEAGQGESAGLLPRPPEQQEQAGSPPRLCPLGTFLGRGWPAQEHTEFSGRVVGSPRRAAHPLKARAGHQHPTISRMLSGTSTRRPPSKRTRRATARCKAGRAWLRTSPSGPRLLRD